MDVQWFISRGKELTIAAKAGRNQGGHEHNDCGSFILCRDGVPLLCDIGAGYYDANYFGTLRYSLFVPSSRSHSVPLIAGREQCMGAACISQEVSCQLGTNDMFFMELSSCYPDSNLVRFTRNFEHQKESGIIFMTDQFTFPFPQAVVERFVSHTPIHLLSGLAIFERDGQTVMLTFDETALDAETVWEEYRGADGRKHRLYLLRLNLKQSANSVCFHFSFNLSTPPNLGG